MDTSALAKRMKKYEAVPKNTLIRRTPVIIRVDGRAFHTFTRGFQKPFDDVLMMAMQDTMKYLCENIQGCVLGYTQSDEITRQFGVYAKAVNKGAMFDARVFNLPKEEVTNNIYWRQLDASRNSIQMLGQANFSHRELLNKTCNQIQDMLMTQHGINWNDMGTSYKRGSCCVRNRRVISTSDDGTVTCEIRNPKEPETAWVIDNEIPIFKGEGRKYIDELIFIGGVEI